MLPISYWIAMLLIAALGGLFALHQLHDFDLLWHIKTGAWMWEHGQVPQTDPFGGRTSGMPWLDVSWLCQLLLAAIFGTAGMVGVQLFFVCVVSATLLVLPTRSGLDPTLLIATLLFVLSSGQYFLVRPSLLSIPLTMAGLALVDLVPRAPLRAALLSVLLSAFWVNLHGSFILLPIFFLLGALGAHFSALPRRASHYGLAAALSLLAALANPYTFRIFRVLEPYARSILAAVGARPATEGLVVLEWSPGWRELWEGEGFPRIPVLLLVLLLVISFVRLGRKAPAGRALCAAFLLALAASALRNLLPFGAGALWIIASNERDRRLSDSGPVAASSWRRAWTGHVIGAVTAVAVAGVAGYYLNAVLTDRYYVRRDMTVVTGMGPYLDLVPEGAVQWLAKFDPPGGVYNNYDSGAFLLFRLHPHVRNYIDSRFDTTPVAAEMLQALVNPAVFDTIVERDRIGTIVLVHPSAESLYLLPRLQQDARWKLAFRDGNSTIHVRSDAYPPALRAAPLALEPATGNAVDRVNSFLERFKQESFPALEITDGFISVLLNDPQRAREAYRRALLRSPGNPVALRLSRAVQEDGKR